MINWNLNDWNELTRRRFMTRAAKVFLGVGVAPLAGSALSAAAAASHGPRPRAQSVIYLNLFGGVSHIDTFDPKPYSPDVQGPVKPLATNVPGIHVTEFLPRTAGHFEKLALIRSMTSNQGDHPPGQYLLHRSYLQGGTISHPTLAAWAVRCLGRINPELPGSVAIAGNEDSISAGFLDLKYAPLPVGDPKQGLANAKVPDYVGNERLEKRLAMARSFNDAFSNRYDYRQTGDHTSIFADAVRLMKSKDLKGFDISLEPPAISARYGRHSFGQGCLLARRLVEHGVRFVEVGFGGWDSHYDNFIVVAELAAVLDRALSALLADLEQRGMLEDTLVVVGTEFGRSPEINPAHKNGRDHHPNAFTCLLAGGGVRGGQVYGSSDSRGAEVADNPVTIPDLNATIGWALGMPIDEEFTDPGGQQFKIADEGRPVTELFA